VCFAGTNFCDWEKLVFLAGNYFLVIFRKLPSIWNYNILEYKQSNTGEQHADVQHVNHVNQLINGLPLDDPLNCNFVVLFLSDSVFSLIPFFSERKKQFK